MFDTRCHHKLIAARNIIKLCHIVSDKSTSAHIAKSSTRTNRQENKTISHKKILSCLTLSSVTLIKNLLSQQRTTGNLYHPVKYTSTEAEARFSQHAGHRAHAYNSSHSALFAFESVKNLKCCSHIGSDLRALFDFYRIQNSVLLDNEINFRFFLLKSTFFCGESYPCLCNKKQKDEILVLTCLFVLRRLQELL